MAVKSKKLSIENARLIFRNFSGAAKKYNPVGRRNFCVLIDPKIARQLFEDGWNIKELPPREEGDEPTPYLQVTVSFRHIPPKILLITSRNKTQLDEDMIDRLDWVEIETADLIISPYPWTANGKSGVTAYLHAAYITIVEDEFEAKYADYPENI